MGLDVVTAILDRARQRLEVRLRFGECLVVDVDRLGLPGPATFVLQASARRLLVGLASGRQVELGVERVVAELEPAFREHLARAASPNLSVGARIRALRLASGRTAMSVAEAAGMARSNYARLEAARHEPRLATLRAVASALGVPLDALLAEPPRRSESSGARPRRFPATRRRV